ncbi:uncharacterized protein LOC144821654 [Lissotriton helveticus]
MDTSTESQKAGRKRNPKFSTMELQTLVEEVVRVHTQLYGRQSLTVPESTKRRLWLDIGEKVNAVGVTHRSLDDLKKRFYDIRGVTKRKLADLHKQAGLTGGGTNRAPPLTQLEELVATTIERASVVGIGDLDSSSRATATGAPSGGGAASAPAPTASAAVASTSAAAQEEEDNSCALANEEDTGHSLTTPHSPRLSQSQSPSLVFSPDNTPPQSHPAPATSPARRRIVAPLVIMEGAAVTIMYDMNILVDKPSNAYYQGLCRVAREISPDFGQSTSGPYLLAFNVPHTENTLILPPNDASDGPHAKNPLAAPSPLMYLSSPTPSRRTSCCH